MLLFLLFTPTANRSLPKVVSVMGTEANLHCWMNIKLRMNEGKKGENSQTSSELYGAYFPVISKWIYL